MRRGWCWLLTAIGVAGVGWSAGALAPGGTGFDPASGVSVGIPAGGGTGSVGPGPSERPTLGGSGRVFRLAGTAGPQIREAAESGAAPVKAARAEKTREFRESVRSVAAAMAQPERESWIKITFGLDGKVAAWDGTLRAEGVSVVEMRPWSFERRDRFDPTSQKWFCSTVVLKGRSASSFAEPQRGVLVRLRSAAGGGRLIVTTRQGRFEVALKELRVGTPVGYLDGRASAERLGSSAAFPPAVGTRVVPEGVRIPEGEDDFPATAVDVSGAAWVAWIRYDDANKRDHLLLARCAVAGSDPGVIVRQIETASEQAFPVLVAEPTGGVRLFWAAPTGSDGDWEIFTAVAEAKGAGEISVEPVQQLTHARGSDIHLAGALGPDGSVWLVWQGFRGPQSDVFAMRRGKGGWSEPVRLGHAQADDWEPAVSVAPDGTAWVAYDSYVNGNYDVFVQRVSVDVAGGLSVSPPQVVFGSADFEAHASVDASDGRTVWVACDAGGPNWGKDFTRDETQFHGHYGETLHGSRRLRLRALRQGRLFEPAVAVPQRLNRLHPRRIQHSDTDEYRRFYELPQLARDGRGRLWLLFRLNRQGYAGHPRQGVHWEIYATTFAGDHWIEPVLLALSDGRQNQKAGAAAWKDGLLLAWSTGDHLRDEPQRLRVGRLGADASIRGIASVPLEPVGEDRAVTPPEPEVRSWPMVAGGGRYEVFFGDLHRHTSISLCFPTADGCLVDAYRYALDAARLDFLGITDHTRDTDPYPWWRSQKAADWFNVEGRLATLYSYERSNGTVNGGHRNVFFIERGRPVLRSDAHYGAVGVRPPRPTAPDVSLYPELRRLGGLTAAHTPGYSARQMRGTWTYHDPQVEPFAEIIQTFRRDYLRPGQPEWPDARVRGNLPEEASVWFALARGYKLGFVASSDHHATHTSYACVWATECSRAAVFEALRARRTYAATDKILLEFRLGDHVLGETVRWPTDRPPTFDIHVRGTGPLADVQLVRNREVIWRTEPGGRELRTVVRDTDRPAGPAFYYVRILQKDNNMAWSSPIWLE